MLTDSVESLKARSLLFSFASAFLSEPDSEKFSALRSLQTRETILQTCAEMSADCAATAESILGALSQFQVIQEDYVRLFGHTLSRDISPYELEHSTTEVFAMTQNLADINGFYQAFGLQISSSERADHIAVEAEFMSYLLLKEAHAIEELKDAEKAAICREARMDFGRDHFFWWAAPFAQSLQHRPSSFYESAGRFLEMLIRTE